ncbi:MAG: hypothetical protein P1P82_00120 [Bacteroidales bacterium]|nr:hypothetical protein [Bacteroidales bacterium]MDT8429959.1 hypothetical protein [Bacteroidales bacterium]
MTIPGTSEEFAAIGQAFYNDGFRLAGSVQTGNDNERLLLLAVFKHLHKLPRLNVNH